MSVTIDTSGGRGRPRDPRRRQAILDAAIALVGEVGFDRMTVEALAARAGVSKPTIYRRWPGGKGEIVVEAIRALRAEAGPDPDTGSLRGDLLAMLEQVAKSFDAKVAGGMLNHIGSSDELTALIRGEVVAQERARYQVLLDRAHVRGETRDDITPLFADIPGSVIFSRRLIAGEPVDRAFLVELVDNVLLPLVSKKDLPNGS
jgi:AcrR family transcriptional regulator